MADNYIQNWTEVYKDICETINTEIENVKWQDLWHNQVGFLTDEHSFETPAVFHSFRILNTEDMHEGAQDVTLQIDMYLFYETMLDTNFGAYNQDDALEFLDTITKLHQAFHGKSGKYYSEMRRVGFSAVDTGSAGNLYLQTFKCKMRDLSAVKGFDIHTSSDIEITRENAPIHDLGNDFMIP